MALKGNAGFRYTPPGGTEVTVNLNYPLIVRGLDDNQTRRVARSDDRSVEEVTVVGTPNAVLVADLRFIDNPQAVHDMLSDGAEGVQMIYEEDLGTATTYPCYLMNKSEAKRLEPDRDREAYGEFETRLVLERRDGGNFSGLLP